MQPSSADLRIVPSQPPTTGMAEQAHQPFDEIFQCYSAYVAVIAFRILGRDDEVDDVVQDVFLDAWQGIQRLRDPSAVKGWLATVAVRCASRRLRQRRLKAFLGLREMPSYQNLVAPNANQEQHLLLRKVYAILDRLPVRERLAWILRHVEGEDLKEVARLCGCSLATAKRRIAAAHQSVVKGLEHEKPGT